MHTCSVAQLCLTLCNLVDCSRPGSSVHGISQARILEWVAISFSRGSSRSWGRIPISCIGMHVLYHWATKEGHVKLLRSIKSRHWCSVNKKRFLFSLIHINASKWCLWYLVNTDICWRFLKIIIGTIYWVLTTCHWSGCCHILSYLILQQPWN